jgi:hypothetical protein
VAPAPLRYETGVATRAIPARVGGSAIQHDALGVSRGGYAQQRARSCLRAATTRTYGCQTTHNGERREVNIPPRTGVHRDMLVHRTADFGLAGVERPADAEAIQLIHCREGIPRSVAKEQHEREKSPRCSLKYLGATFQPVFM